MVRRGRRPRERRSRAWLSGEAASRRSIEKAPGDRAERRRRRPALSARRASASRSGDRVDRLARLSTGRSGSTMLRSPGAPASRQLGPRAARAPRHLRGTGAPLHRPSARDHGQARGVKYPPRLSRAVALAAQVPGQAHDEHRSPWTEPGYSRDHGGGRLDSTGMYLKRFSLSFRTRRTAGSL